MCLRMTAGTIIDNVCETNADESTSHIPNQ